jgi:hypothetical protein
MATVKISNLPLAPQNWNLTDVLPVVDSGSTTTSKQTLEYLFGNWSGQIINSSNQYFMAANGTGPGGITIGSSNRTTVMSSERATTSGSVDLFIAGARDDGGQGISTQSLEGCAALGVKGAINFNTSAGSVILGSHYVNSYGVENTFHLGSNSIDILGNVFKGGTIACNNGTLNNSQNAVLMACQSSDLNLAGGNTGVVVGSYDSQNYNYGASARATGVWGSGASKVYSKNFVSNVFGSFNCDINDDLYSTQGTRAASILGSYNSEIRHSASAVVYNQSILNSYQSFIEGNVEYSNTILGSDYSKISGGSNNMIIGSANVQHSNLDGAVSIGVLSGNDALYGNTVHTDNMHTYKVQSFTEVNGGNVGGNVDVDCSQGSFFLFTMTANTTPNFINVRDGQRFFFIVYNSGNFAVPTATVNGVSGKVFAKNGTINPQNSSYSKYVATYDGVNGLLFLDEETGFAAV